MILRHTTGTAQTEAEDKEVVVGVPIGFFNMRLVIALLLLYWLQSVFGIPTWIGLGGGGQWTHPISWTTFCLHVPGMMVWFVGLLLWTRVWVVGYWWVAVAAHLQFAIAIIATISGQSIDVQIVSGFLAAIVFVFMLTNIWSGELLKFFRTLNGRCPLCHGSPCGAPKERKAWTCPACQSTLTWSTAVV
jgi:hypothetical protein